MNNGCAVDLPKELTFEQAVEFLDHVFPGTIGVNLTGPSHYMGGWVCILHVDNTLSSSADFYEVTGYSGRKQECQTPLEALRRALAVRRYRQMPADYPLPNASVTYRTDLPNDDVGRDVRRGGT